jgi:cytochrome c-type biogenesis protein CcmH/NrfF
VLKYFFLILSSLITSLALCDEIETKTQAISEQVMSPYCPGRTLSSCPSEDARKLRFQISEWLSQGYSESAVKRQLIGIYGSDVIGQPEFKGFGKIAWVSPFLIIIAAFCVLLGFLRKDKISKNNDLNSPENLDIENKLKDLEKI